MWIHAQSIFCNKCFLSNNSTAIHASCILKARSGLCQQVFHNLDKAEGSDRKTAVVPALPGQWPLPLLPFLSSLVQRRETELPPRRPRASSARKLTPGVTSSLPSILAALLPHGTSHPRSGINSPSSLLAALQTHQTLAHSAAAALEVERELGGGRRAAREVALLACSLGFDPVPLRAAAARR